jgi:F-type H+-transporting ATPase subunit epsilon
MAETIRLEVVTPERVVLEEDVDQVEVPGFDGALGILPGHTQLVSRLKPAGLLTYHQGEKKGEMAISDGFVEVGPYRVTVLANKAYRPEEIDLPRALRLKQDADQQLNRALTDPDADINKALVDVEKATVALLIAERRG